MRIRMAMTDVQTLPTNLGWNKPRSLIDYDG